jgi:hypothetical protein
MKIRLPKLVNLCHLSPYPFSDHAYMQKKKTLDFLSSSPSMSFSYLSPHDLPVLRWAATIYPHTESLLCCLCSRHHPSCMGAPPSYAPPPSLPHKDDTLPCDGPPSSPPMPSCRCAILLALPPPYLPHGAGPPLRWAATAYPHVESSQCHSPTLPEAGAPREGGHGGRWRTSRRGI